MKKGFIYVAILLLSVFKINAQEHIPFQAGEELKYDMYFKLGIVNTKAGSSKYATTKTSYEGHEAWKVTVHANSTGVIKNFYTVSDTLFSYISTDLRPLLFQKYAHEGKDYTIENATYTYSPGQIKIHTKRVRNEKLRFDTTLYSKTMVYDMLSILYHVRTINFDSLIKNKVNTITYISGKRISNMDIKYTGKERIKANDGRRYDCLKLVMLINDKAFENRDEAMRVYITNDENRLPVRIDTKLKKGTMRVILNNYKKGEN